jgi:hypothetical protein
MEFNVVVDSSNWNQGFEFSIVSDSSNWNQGFEFLPEELSRIILNFCDKKDYYHILLTDKYRASIVQSDYSFKEYFFNISKIAYLSFKELINLWKKRNNIFFLSDINYVVPMKQLIGRCMRR